MKTSLLLTSLSVAIALTGCNKSTRSNTASNPDYTAANSSSTAANTTAGNGTISTNDNNFRANANHVAGDVSSAANSAASALGNAAGNVATSARMVEWKLTSNDIQADLDQNNEIVRTKDTQPGTPTGTTDKSVIESMVKGRLEADSDIAALKLKVDADKHGAVKLTGKAQSAEEVGRAIALALDTEGVTKVSSKIKLDKDAKTTR